MRSTRGTTFERLTSFLKASATVAYFSGSSTKISKVGPFVVKLFRPRKRRAKVVIRVEGLHSEQ